LLVERARKEDRSVKHWLKSLGTQADRIPERGLASIGWITNDIGFPVDPSVRPGDRLVLYASGYGLFFGVVEVNLAPQLDNRAKPWSYRVRVRARLVIDELGRAPDLDEASAGKRDLRKSVRQQSHIRLTPEEYDAAVGALEARVDLAAGDVRSAAPGGKI
jgi:hypothetical protein